MSNKPLIFLFDDGRDAPQAGLSIPKAGWQNPFRCDKTTLHEYLSSSDIALCESLEYPLHL